MVDVGGGVSSLAMYHEGELIHTAVLPIGSRHITNDLAIAFRTSVDNAEQIKLAHGIAGTADIPSTKKEQIDLTSILGEPETVVPRKHIAKIVDARISELFDMISQELKKISSTHLLPAGLVLSGGGANLAGLPAFAKDRLGLTVRIGGDYVLDGVSEQVRDPAYAVAVGLVMWGFDRAETTDNTNGLINKVFGNTIKKAGKWLKNFMP